MKKLKLSLQRPIIADKKTLVAWDYDERLYKKVHFIAGAIFKKHGIVHTELKAPWPHISAALVAAPLTRDERDKFKMAGGIIKPKFVFKKFDILMGQETPFDYFSIEFNNPPEFDKFLKFAQDICGEDRVVKYEKNRPHLSLWALKKGDHADIEKVLPEIQQEAKKYLQPFISNKMSIWDDFEVSEIESIGGVNVVVDYTWRGRIRSKYQICAAYPKHLTGQELLSFVEKITPDSEGMNRVERVISEISGMWELQKIKISDIPWDDASVKGKGSQRLITKYSKKDREFPPIILDETWNYAEKKSSYEIIDGFHRIAAAKKCGETYIMAYVPVGDL